MSARIIPFPAFDRGLDDDDPRVVSIFNAKPLPCDFADNRADPYAGLEEAARRAVFTHLADAMERASVTFPASGDTRRDGEDATKIAAEFTSGAVPHGDEADAPNTPPSNQGSVSK